MTIKLCSVGGFDEVGKNMVAAKVDSDAVIFDMGFHMQKLMDFEEAGGERKVMDYQKGIEMGAIPDDRVIESWRSNVKAIIPSHCHLDHIGAIPFMADRYKAPVIGTPYTMEVLRTMIESEDLNFKNKIETLHTGRKMKLTDNISIELIHITHSTPDTALVALHTPKGIILYANDFKLDDTPVLGKKPNYERLKELGESGKVKAIFVDALYSRHDRKTPSEKVAKEMLKEVLFTTENSNNAIFVSCFASHIARLTSLAEFGEKLGRRVVFLGRSMYKYVAAAEKLGITSFKGVDIVAYKSKIERYLHKIHNKGAEKYLVVATGGQGEKNSVLSKILRGDLHFKFKKDDAVIFSNRIIPVEPNITNRAEIERKFKEKGVRIFSDVHVSGHGAIEDMRELIKLVNPEHVIPSHGNLSLVQPLTVLAEKMGYKMHKEVHLMKNGEELTI